MIEYKVLFLHVGMSKPAGSVNLEVIAKHVGRTVTIKVLDLVFYSTKLMNAGKGHCCYGDTLP